VSQAVDFSATCPHCKREQLQEGYTLADLMRLLYGGYPVEAYCTFCDEFWIVSIQKRVELGEFVAAACGRISSPTTRAGVDGQPPA
jgi:hypothetical protein